MTSSTQMAAALIVLAGTLLVGLASGQQKSLAPSLEPVAAADTKLAITPRAATAYLTEQAAAERATRISNVSYVLDLVLTGAADFTGSTQVDFDLADTRSPLTLDIDAARIRALVVNGKALAPQYNQWFLTLPAGVLVEGRNRVSVSYQRAHGTDGEGLHRFKDPVDGRVYLYSHFEPAAAQQMFALFDQPDLKATFTLSVSAPKDWQVVSAMRETSIASHGTMRRWQFPPTPKLSPYNFSLHAGPYRVWEDVSGKYPMRLFARQSVAAQVSAKEWFRYTKAGLLYFDDYFDIPYPFAKYDQLLVPQFIYGAMENAAAVTFSEDAFLSASAMSKQEREDLASTILHEMAHQWFGDLVTMAWWNGLWLNESFASYMAQMAGAASGEIDNPWLPFYNAKQDAYRTDESITTHPVEVAVPSTANAFDNIDAITYSKGAATLHQLRMMMGDEPFRRGVHDYLVKHSYGNATLHDFISALSTASGRDLHPWARAWLYEPGLNTVSADFQCANGTISTFSLRQSAANPAYPALRQQLVQVALFKLKDGRLELLEKVAVNYAGAATGVEALQGHACPDLAYPNYGDWGYVRAVLDPVSFATASAHLSAVTDPMLRSMLWQSLSDGMRERRISLDAFVQTVLFNLPLESDYTLLGQALGYLSTAKDYLRKFGDRPGADSADLSLRIERTLWSGLLASRADRDRAELWLEAYIDVAESDTAMDMLRGLLSGAVDGGGIRIDQDLRWSIIIQLSRQAASGSEALIEKEIGRDKSNSGQLSALAARAVRPEAAGKKLWLAKIQQHEPTVPFSNLRAAMRHLYPSGQEALSEETAEQRLQTLAAVDKAEDPVFMRSYAYYLIPAACNEASVQRLAQAVASLTDLSATTRRALQRAHEEDQRCVAIRDASITLPR